MYKRQTLPGQLASWGQLNLCSSAERLLADQRNPKTMATIMHPQACLLYKHVLLPQNKPTSSETLGMKHELICVLVVSPILNPRLWPRPEHRDQLHVFINRQGERGKREMSPKDDWNHMELVESNSSCDNIACSSPLPLQPPYPTSPTLSHVTDVQERLQLEKVNRWLGPRTKWSWFSKSTCGIWGGNGFAAKHSITRNYNNSTLEDGLFHFIMRFALSCLRAGGGEGAAGTATGTLWNRYSVTHLNAFSFSFNVLQELSPWTIIFAQNLMCQIFTHIKGQLVMTSLNYKRIEGWVSQIFQTTVY